MLFKEERFRKQFWTLHPKLRYLLCKVDYLLWSKFGKEAKLTCLFYEGGSGVHSITCGRATDISTHNLTAKEIIWIKDHINENFPYDPKRPEKKTCIYHKVDKEKIKEYSLKNFVPQYHFHFQVWVV